MWSNLHSSIHHVEEDHLSFLIYRGQTNPPNPKGFSFISLVKDFFLFGLKDLVSATLKSLNAFGLFSLITSKIFQLPYRYRYQFVPGVMTDMRHIKEMI